MIVAYTLYKAILLAEVERKYSEASTFSWDLLKDTHEGELWAESKQCVAHNQQLLCSLPQLRTYAVCMGDSRPCSGTTLRIQVTGTGELLMF